MIVKQNAKSGNSTFLRNDFIQDHRLSAKARALCAYLNSLPPNWRINTALVAKNQGYSTRTLFRLFAELKKYDYLQIKRLQDDKGRFKNDTIYNLNLEQSQEFAQLENEDKELMLELLKEDLKEQESPNNQALNQTAKIPSCQECQDLKKKEFTKKEKNNECEFFEKLDEKNLPKESKEAKKARLEARKNELSKSVKSFLLLSLGLKNFAFMPLKNEQEQALKGVRVQKESFEIPNNLNEEEKELFKDFLAFRKERGKLSYSQAVFLAKKVFKAKQKGLNVKAMLERSLNAGWLGLFEPKQSKGYVPKFFNPHDENRFIVKELYAQKEGQDFDLLDFLDDEKSIKSTKIKGRSIGLKGGLLYFLAS